MIEKKTWEQFRDTGLFWFINNSLHLFGWCIVLNIEDGEITGVYPARCKFRGFNEDANEEGFKKVSKYLKENINEIEKEARE